MIECKFSLELTKNGIQRSVHAKAGEANARKLIISLTQNGKVYDLTGHSAKICLENGTCFPDKKVEIIGNTVQAIIPNSFEESQVRICELTITCGGEKIYSPMFELVVEESLGSKTESESLQEGVEYQEVIALAPEKNDEMEDEDYVVVYDADNNDVRKLSWVQVIKLMSDSVVKEHNVLDGRDEENQHPIGSITGLQEALALKSTEIGNTENKLTKMIEEIDEKQTEALEKESYDNQSSHNHFQSEIDRIEQYVWDAEEAVYKEINGLKESGSVGMTPEQVELLNANTKARHTHENADTLNKLTTSVDGNLLFDGEEIKSSGSVLDVEVKTDTEDEYVLELMTPTETITTSNLKGKQGVSGVYVGEGDMPDGYNVQIIPSDDPIFTPENPELPPLAGSGNAVSPTIDITKIEGGHRITITDIDGTKSFDVLNGKDYILTDTDKTEIANAVLDSLAVAEGGLY